MCTFERRLREEDAIVGYYPDLLAIDASEPGDEGGTVVFLELGEFAAVNYSSDDLVSWDLFAEIRAYDASEFFGVMEGLLEGCVLCIWNGPVEIANRSASKDQGVSVVDSKIIGDAGDGTV